jgi:hypothetical protein
MKKTYIKPGMDIFVTQDIMEENFGRASYHNLGGDGTNKNFVVENSDNEEDEEIDDCAKPLVMPSLWED